MKMTNKSLIALLLMLLLLASVTVASAEATSVQVYLYGLTGQPDGQWAAEALEGSFRVIQNGTEVGVLKAGEGYTLTLPADDSVQLQPVEGTISSEYRVYDAGSSVSITPATVNVVRLMVYADKGLVRIKTDGAAEYGVYMADASQDPEQKYSYVFATDQNGEYTLPEALKTGAYVLHQMTPVKGQSVMADVGFIVPQYMGFPDDIVTVDMRAATIAAYGTPAPVSTPVPTAAPTVVPETNADLNGDLAGMLMDVTGEDAPIGYRILNDTEVISEGYVSVSSPLTLSGLQPGSYTLEFNVPEGYAIQEINSQRVSVTGKARCLLPLGSGDGNHYRIALVALVKVQGVAAGIPDGTEIQLVGSQDKANAVVYNGAFSVDALMQGEYRVTVTLPDGQYTGEGWSFEREQGVVHAVGSATYTSGQPMTVPAISRVVTQMVSGRVMTTSGKAVADAQVSFEDAAGMIAATSYTDANGMWYAVELATGQYSLTVMQDGDVLAHNIAASVTEGYNTPLEVVVQEGSATISVCVFNDKNKNGEYNNYDAAMSDVEVALIHVEGAAETVISTGVTDRKGMVKFDMLPAGDYRVRVTLPEGYGFSKKSEKDGLRSTYSMMEQTSETEQTSEVLTVSGRQKIECGAGAMQMSAVSGRVWIDENGDGLMNGSEPVQSGITVQAIGTKNGLVYETVTSESGEYKFTQLRPGSYNIFVTLPEGFGFTKYAKGNGHSIITEEGVSAAGKVLDLNNAKAMKDQHIGIIRTGSFSIICFQDENHNGYYDEDEAVLPGVVCSLFKQSGKNSLATATSDDSGALSFTALRPGQYRVRATLPEGGAYSFTIAADGGNLHTGKLGVQAVMVENITVEAGEDHAMVIGAVIPGTISGKVYMDDNFNGAMDPDERSVGDLNVALIDENGQRIATAQTNREGVFSFQKVYPGDYRVSVQARTGYGFTKPGNGSVITVQSSGAGMSDLFRLGMGQDLEGLDCGLIVPGLVDGCIWLDNNDNQSRDEDEGGMMTMRVKLVADDGTVTEAQPGTNGVYTFDAVIPGTYHVEYVLPEYGEFVSENMDAAMTVSPDGTYASSGSFEITMGGEHHFGETGALQLIPVGGLAYYDVNVNGVRDAEERLLSGLVLTFTSMREDRPDSVVTMTAGEDGKFNTAALRPGQYQLDVSFPHGYMMGVKNEMLPLTPGKANEQLEIEALSGENWSLMTIGAVKPALIQGYIWMDEDTDGRMDQNEDAPAGEKVTMIDLATGETYAELITDSYGCFTKTDVMPGEYKLVYTLHNGAVPSLGGETTFEEQDGMMIMDHMVLNCDDKMDQLRLGLISYTSIGGMVWADHSGRVVPLAGAQVRLLNNIGQVQQTTTSGEDGRYQFDGLRTGIYVLDVMLPEYQLVVTQDDSRIAGDRGAVSVMTVCIDRYGKSDPISVRMGYHQMGLDIGAVGYGAIGDRCWLDLNGNGLQDSDEGGLPNMLVQLVYNGEVVAETMTDVYGYYRFNNIYPAEYTLRVAYDANVLRPTVMRTDIAGIVSVLTEDGAETRVISVTSNGATYEADMGFVLVDEAEYPLGYGMDQPMNWNPKRGY